MVPAILYAPRRKREKWKKEKGEEEEKGRKREERKRKGNMKEDLKTKPRVEVLKERNKVRTNDRTGISVEHLFRTSNTI